MGVESEVSPQIYSPLFWPATNLHDVLKEKPKSKVNLPECTPTLSIKEHLKTFAGAIRSFLMALFIVYGLYGDNQYPAYGRAAKWSLEWIIPMTIRNILATILICGFWDYLLYFSPIKHRFEPYKFNKDYPSTSQFSHDIFWTLFATLTGTAIEILLCHFWATGAIAFEKQLRTSPISNFLWAILVTHWRLPHFYAIHRVIHPWKTDRIFDVGKWMYKHVHSLHHKSYNPTAFSGTSMHPVESTMYYTAPLIAVAFGCHPSIVMGCMVDCAVGAWIGHDGFQWPGAGDYYHYLHHAHFDCNYGNPHIPIDYWLGTFIAKKGDLKKIWGKRKSEVGHQANAKVVPVHEKGEIEKEE